ncbi:hypothetical protein LWP59_07610 [Amycolatopsis acidiphila]|uniref:hypothetical protein n=1 Tax=Amycolatopsis acidiphila TaxID=715473 RepID=UPI0019A39A69|nr:hypothetical protein [Amycolatopsis acidiphila]UIJ61481.1 hypothetical protein LWP59_07610 [Amycolatopsis acidiphila]GHG59671.1 hypothetical protein GCM10017788_13310 [Amycolatopsis acidiphila]
MPEDNFKDFTAAFKQQEGADPGTYSPEGYDVATILLKGIDSGAKDRAGLLDFVKDYDGQGLTKHFKWDTKGELADTPVWSYRVQNGKIVNNGEISGACPADGGTRRASGPAPRCRPLRRPRTRTPRPPRG